MWPAHGKTILGGKIIHISSHSVSWLLPIFTKEQVSVKDSQLVALAGWLSWWEHRPVH